MVLNLIPKYAKYSLKSNSILSSSPCLAGRGAGIWLYRLEQRIYGSNDILNSLTNQSSF